MNVEVKTVVVSFTTITSQCKILLDKYNKPLSIDLEYQHKDVEAAVRQSISSVLKTDASWMPIRFLFFKKNYSQLDIYYGVLVPEDIVRTDTRVSWIDINKLINNDGIDKDVQEAIWEAVRKVK